MSNTISELKAECDRITSSSVVGHQHFEKFLKEQFNDDNSNAVQALFKVIAKSEELSQKITKIDEFDKKLNEFSERLTKLENDK